MNIRFHVIAAMIVSLLVAVSVHGAERRSVTGHVTDTSRNPLPGAIVHVEPGNLTVITDRAGYFAAPDLEPGAYTIEVSYVGFLPEKQEFRLGTNTPANIEVKLNLAPSVADEITVSASRPRGEVESLNQRKSAVNIVDILPAEVISSLPNANVAEALARLPSVSVERDEGEPKFVQIRGLEPRFTSVTINGVQIPSTQAGIRQIKLDAFPSDLVEAIELHKTISADQDGDAIGGSVNLVTKSAGDETSYSVSAEGGYESLQGGRPSSRSSATYTTRVGTDNALGIVFGGTYDYNGRAINDVEPAPGVVALPDGTSQNVFTATDFRDYRYARKRFGFAGGLDYRLSNNSSMYLRGFLSQFQNYGDRWATSISAGTFLTPTLTDASGGFSANVQHRTPNEQTYSLAFGGVNNLGTGSADYNISYSRARQNSIAYTTADFNGPSAAFTVDSSNGYFPKFVPMGGVNPMDPSQYTLADLQISNNKTAAPSTAVVFNYTFPLNVNVFKVGAKYRDEHKTNFTYSRYFNANGSPGFVMSQGLASFRDHGFYFGRYPEGPNASLAAVEHFFSTSPGAFTEDISKEHLRNDPNNWDAKEKVSAAYAKDSVTFGRLQLEGGARVEHTSSAYNAFLVARDPKGKWLSTSPTSGRSSYTDVLPSVSAKYVLDPNTNFRAVYGWALGRPDFGLLVPSLVLSDTRKQINAGNPNLKPTKAQSYDVMFEHFLESVGVISAGAFYKNLRDPIYAGSTSIIHGGIDDGYTRIEPINGPKASIYGFEVAWQQHFGFLPGLLSGLGIDANYTHTDSRATFDPSTGRTGTARLQRTTPNAANFGITYDRGGLAFRAAATYNSATIFFYNYQDGADGGLKGPNGDTYLYPHTQIDAQISYTMPGGYQLFVSGLNLNNEVFGFYNGSPAWNIQREFYNRTYSAGVRVLR